MLQRDTLIETLRLLVSIPSVNPNLAPGEGTGEAAIANAICEWFGKRGVRAWTEEAAPGRLNAVAQVGTSDGPVLVLCAHTDTVATDGMAIPPFAARLEDAKLYGRGAYDMKGSVAAIMCAMDALQRERLGGRVMAALVADEEYASVGAMDFVLRHRADACVVTEPSDGDLILGHKGFVWAEIVTTGRAAHGSRWDLGDSAIARMGRVVAALDEFDRRVLRSRVHPLIGPASMHCALIEGGVGLSTYAPRCRLQVERRTIPGEDAHQVGRELRDVIADAGEEAQVTCFFDRPPLTCDPDSPIVNAVRAAAATVTGTVPRDAGVAYWMDAAIFAAAAIPTVNYGPSGAGAHEAVEWVDVESVVTCSQVLIESARRFLR